MADSERHDLSDIIETLENLENGLIEYEETFDAGGGDSSSIHILFRYAHNLKSTLAMVHKEHSSELIHSVENTFDLVRSGKMEVSRELIDKSLDAIDLIKANLFREKELAEELKELKTIFDGFTEAPRADIPSEISILLTDKEKTATTDALVRGEDLYQIEKLIKTDISKENYNNLPIFNDVREIGTLIAVRPACEDMDKKGSETTVKILFASGKTEGDLFFHIFDPFKKVELPGLKTAAHPGVLKDPAAVGTEINGAAAGMPADVSAPKPRAAAPDLEILIVEDDFSTRHLESSILGQYGNCEVAVNGNEAIQAFEKRALGGNPYDVIFLDILIPEPDGHAVLKTIREFEEGRGVHGFERSRVIVVSNLRDMENIFRSFRRQSDSYIIKPITKKKVERELKRLQFI